MGKIQKIMFVSNLFGRFGGLEIYNLDVVHSLQRIGKQVEVFEMSTSGMNVVEGINVHGLAPQTPWIKRINNRLGHLLERVKLKQLALTDYDVVIAGHVNVLSESIKISRKYKIPCWLIVFGIDIWGDLTPKTSGDIQKCDKIIALSSYTAANVQLKLSSNIERVKIIHPMVDVEVFSPAITHMKTNHDALIILTVSRLSSLEQYKGHDLVIKSLQKVIENLGRHVEYWIVGDGDDRQRLEQLAQDIGVGNYVKFKGAVWGNERVNFYRKCDVFAMPSYVEKRPHNQWTGEGFGIVYIEASASEKPVIACDIGGQTDAIQDQITGILVKPTVESVENALTRILSNPAFAKKMGEAGRQFVIQNFTSRNFDKKWHELCEGK